MCLSVINMARMAPDLTGKRFFRLVALARGRRGTRGELYWLCLCDCGSEVEIKAQRLQAGTTKSCGCYTRIWQSEAGKKVKKEGTACRSVLSYYRYNARKRGLAWELTEEQFNLIITSPCHYTGVVESNKLITPSGETFRYNGVDRLDNSKGYTLANSVSCCKSVNAAKSAMNYDEFVKMCHMISERLG
jgi:hypothetical protein